jgi:hypothetical protein
MAGLFFGVFLDARRFSLPFLLVLEFLARLDGHFATRSLAGDCPIELNADKVWAGTGDTGSAKQVKARASPNRRPKAPSILYCGQMGARDPLSNSAETINLGADSRAGNRAGRGSRQGSVNGLRRSGGGPIFQVPIRPTGRTGSGDLEKCVAGCFASAHVQNRSRVGQYARRSALWNFERLSHVAINLQSFFVRAGNVICFCSSNEQ